MKKALMLTLCGIFVLTGCAKTPKLSDGKEIVASLNGKDITAEDLYSSMRDQYGTSVLVNLIDDFIISKEITDSAQYEEEAAIQVEQYKVTYSSQWEDFLSYYGYASEDELKADLIKQAKSTGLVKKYLKEEITEDDLKKYYDENISTELTVKHILIKSTATDSSTAEEKTAAETEAYNKAVELINQLNAGADFETLAKENSEDTGSASNGGLITGVNKAGYDTSFYNAAIALADGKYSTVPVKSQYGYHVILTVSRTEAESYDALKDTLYDKVISKKLSDDSNLTYAIWNKIRQKYNLNIVDTDIKTSYEAAMAKMGK